MSSWLVRLTDEAGAWSTSTIEALDAWVNKPRALWRQAARFILALPVLAATMVVSLVIAISLLVIIAVLETKDLIQDALRRPP